MKRMTRQQIKERDDLAGKVEEAGTKLNETIGKFNSTLEDAKAELEGAQSELNEAINNANAMREQIQGDMESYVDERSEKWQEGDAGNQYQSWIEAWSNELEEVELDLPESLEEIDVESIVAEFRDAPTSPDEA